jgi:hypothetical protein
LRCPKMIEREIFARPQRHGGPAAGRRGVGASWPSAHPHKVVELEARKVERVARERLGELREMMGRQPAEARQLLQNLLERPLTFTRSGRAPGRSTKSKPPWGSGASAGLSASPTGHCFSGAGGNLPGLLEGDEGRRAVVMLRLVA